MLKHYSPAFFSHVTDVDGNSRRTGIAFKTEDGQTVRLKLPVADACQLQTSILHSLLSACGKHGSFRTDFIIPEKVMQIADGDQHLIMTADLMNGAKVTFPIHHDHAYALAKSLLDALVGIQALKSDGTHPAFVDVPRPGLMT